MTPAHRGAARGLDPTREVLVVAGYELRAMLASVRALLLFVVYGLVTFALGAGFVFVQHKAKEQIEKGLSNLSETERAQVMTDERIHQELVKGLTPAAEWLGGQPLVDAITERQLPWVVLFILLFSTFLLPGLVLLVGYDRMADDLGTRYARYVLQRLRRGSWLIGKLIGHWLAVMTVLVAVHLVLVAAAALIAEDIDAGQVASALPKLWLGLSLFILAYAAFTSFMSASIQPPFAALAVGGTVLTMLWFVSTFSPSVRQLWMGTWDMRLWVLDPLAAAVFGGHAVLFGLLAFACLRLKDI